MTRCTFFSVECACGKYSCNALKEAKLVSREQFPICHSWDHVTECLRYGEGVKFHEGLLIAKVNEEK